jgi:hypothetical protein
MLSWLEQGAVFLPRASPQTYKGTSNGRVSSRFTGSGKQDLGSEPFPDSSSISLTEVREGREQY